MIRLIPASLWRKGITADGNPTWRWQPPRLPDYREPGTAVTRADD